MKRVIAIMRIAVLTDIHGNAAALRAVLKEIDSRNDIDHIYCAGDMIGIGPYSNEVLDLLFTRNDVSMVTGNHDEAILSLLLGEEYPNSHHGTREHHQWMAKHLDKAYISKLQQLPRIIRHSVENQTLLMTHYHIEPSRILDQICLDPFSKIVEPTLKNVVSLFKSYEANLILFGHHHPIHFFKNDRTIYLNPGSLGCSHKAAAPYAIVHITRDQLYVQLEEAPYDKSSFIESFTRLQVPDWEFILKVFYGV